MLAFAIIFLFGIIIFQSQKIQNLNAKISYLKKELKKYQNNTDLNELDTKPEIKSTVSKNLTNTSVKKELKPKTDYTISKNLSILITGSILIVLAAIVFLTTAWNTIPNFIKTTVLFLVAFVFLCVSKLSKEKYNLEKTSKTFFYIGMAYLPICLLSISIFGLFGEFLSATGDGKFIYLGASTLVLAILYYWVSKISNDKYLFYGSLLSQILSVILFTLMFEERLFLVFINLLLYNLLLMLIEKDKLFEIVVQIIPGAIVLGTLVFLKDEIGSWYFIITSLLLSVNFIVLEHKKTNIVKSALFNFFLFVFGFSLIYKESFGLKDGTCQVLATIFTIGVFVLENFIFINFKENKFLLYTSRISCLIAISCIYCGSLFKVEKMIIPSYVIAIILEILIIFDFKLSKKIIYKYLGYAFTNILLVDIHNNFFNDFELVNYIPMLTTSIIMFYELYLAKKRDDFLTVYLAGSEALSLCLLSFNRPETNVVLSIAFTIFAIYFNKKTNTNQTYNTIPLMFALPCILDSKLNNELQFGILLLSTIGLTFFSVTASEINIYTIISGIYLVITNYKINNTYFQEILYIAWGSIHVYFCKNQNSKDIFKILTSIFITVLYYTIADDLKILKLTLFEALGIVICGMYIIKFILSKYYKNTEILEYFFWGIIYLYALSNYTDSRDGIIFSILILSVIFFSYYKKYGATFIAGIIAILVNAFALTREFWFSIPWWIYLLVVGGILIGFAIKNEANENREKLSIGKMLKCIKDRVEKE